MHEDLEKPPPLAGHTLTFIKDKEREKLLLIGGFSIEFGLNSDLWEFDADQKLWSKVLSHGAFPIGIFGHSASFHSQSQIVYVFGGFVFDKNNTEISKRLYALDLSKMMWTELPTMREINVASDLLPRARFLHSAVATENYMLIYGGRTHPLNSSDILIAYVYKCNHWIRLTEDVEIIGNLPPPSYAQAMTMDHESGAIYVVGGWDGSSKSRVTRINIPSDLCDLWSSSKPLCLNFMGCSYCSFSQTMPNKIISRCHNSDRRNVCNFNNGTVLMNSGIACDSKLISNRNCTMFSSCTECLAMWPHENQTPCKWCLKDRFNGICTGAGTNCSDSYSNNLTLIDQCPGIKCAATDCHSCALIENCSWAFMDSQWLCLSNQTVEKKNLKVVDVCPLKCSSFKNCSSCLSAVTSEAGYSVCRWSTSLNECLSPSYQSIYCIGGVCGLVLTSLDKQYCPEPCKAYKQCSTCLKHAHCGWCSKNSEGDGVCTEGSLESPTEYPAASTCDIIYASYNNLTDVSFDEQFSWQYVECPAENECINGHHNCNPKSERCVDLPRGYRCECGNGYKSNGNECIPVCTQGCVRGKCINPDDCQCDFGYVGANCSIQCQCNGHSDCRGPDKLDDCIECFNNTIGDQCEKCKPLFVGDPRDNGECVPCFDYCNGHTDICVANDAEPTVKSMTREFLESNLKEGPKTDALCLRCQNNTDGDRCETCIVGHFRGTDNHREICRPCECHGHGDTCDPVTGEKCNCGNNTDSDISTCTNNSKFSNQCWMHQCAKCKDSYVGVPTDGHQCYKQLNVEAKMCFDAKTIDECKIIPSSLKPGQTVFFVVQPRFMNVDIRLIIDVTQGELDLYISPQQDSFIVQNNFSTGQHEIYLDNRFLWRDVTDLIEDLHISPFNDNYIENGSSPRADHHYLSPTIPDCKTLDGSGFYVKDKKAKDLSTYFTLRQCNTLLRVYGLKNRFVLTIPQSAHNLSATRFFMALKATSTSSSTYGLIFFRQDQQHIDLFVFFSVFFSFFFLFLSVCVVAWKAKQAADMRRARRRHVVEMLHMAKRPFASIFLLPGSSGETPHPNRRRGRTKHSPSSALSLNANYDLKPIAIEPTSDGIAAVSTVFIRLPSKNKSSMTLALASALTTTSTRQYPSGGGRAFLRRRGSNHGNMPPNLN